VILNFGQGIKLWVLKNALGLQELLQTSFGSTGGGFRGPGRSLQRDCHGPGREQLPPSLGQTPEMIRWLVVLLSARCISFAYVRQRGYVSVVEAVAVGPHWARLSWLWEHKRKERKIPKKEREKGGIS
jgi:hypothetical protein